MTISEIIALSGLSRKEFSEEYKIPYRTIQNWELGIRECPSYLLELLEFRVAIRNWAKENNIKLPNNEE